MAESSARRRIESISRHLCTNQLSVNEEELPGGAPVIVGGMVLDIHGKPVVNPDPATTTPGKVKYVNGGVARNVAECMSKLGSKPFLISVTGNDIAGAKLMEYWRSTGLPTEGILQLSNVNTPVVSNIFDCKGELIAGVASVDAVEAFLTPDWIDRFRGIICRAPLVMVDANLSPLTLEATCKMAVKVGVPVWFEPVSVSKSTRIVSISNYVTCVTPNETELIAMAKALSPKTKFQTINLKQFENEPDCIESLFQFLKPAILCLFHHGIKLILVTLGSNGIFLCHVKDLNFPKSNLTRNSNPSSALGRLCRVMKEAPSKLDGYFAKRSSEFCVFHLPAVTAKVVGLTGAGDCLVGGTLVGMSVGLDVARSCVVGLVAAKAAVESENNVPDKFDVDSIADEAKRVLLSVKPLLL